MKVAKLHRHRDFYSCHLGDETLSKGRHKANINNASSIKILGQLCSWP